MDGKLDKELPPRGRGSARQQEYDAELEKFMSTFKMQAQPPHPPVPPGKVAEACSSYSTGSSSPTYVIHMRTAAQQEKGKKT